MAFKKTGPDEHLFEKTELRPGLTLPKAFAIHWDEIEKSKLTTAAIKATPQEKMAFNQSKFGHYPLLPSNFEYPKDADGDYMYPLAQINCRDLPPLQEGFPTSGYLQFYISGFDDVYGLDFDDQQSQKNFRVLFFEEHEVEVIKSDFSFLDEVMKSDMLPMQTPVALRFETKDEYVGIGEVRFGDEKRNNLSGITEKYPQIAEDLESEAYDYFSSNGHKVGGYAYFTQSDPREGSNEFKDYILLLQIDSVDDIMWGDVGVANFFIHPDDLKKKDFSKVMYNWDCC